jgi:uncharacterized iron-regulated protein
MPGDDSALGRSRHPPPKAPWLARTICFFCFAALAACSSTGPIGGTTTDPRIWDVRAARWVTESQLVAALASVRYRLLGEIHDNPEHHTIRARLISELAARDLHPAVVMEQFDLDHDEALRAAQASSVDAETLADAGQLDRKGWLWPMHKPILEAAVGAHLPVRAANLPRTFFSHHDVQSLVEKDTSAIWYARFHAAKWTDAQATELHDDILASHCGKVPESVVPRIVLAQRIRDAAMAQALVDAAASVPEPGNRGGAILIAGDGHVRADLGVPIYLHAPGTPGADARSSSVGLVEASDEERHANDFPRALVAEHPGFDYIWFTPPAAREDPCAGM